MGSLNSQISSYLILFLFAYGNDKSYIISCIGVLGSMGVIAASGVVVDK